MKNSKKSENFKDSSSNLESENELLLEPPKLHKNLNETLYEQFTEKSLLSAAKESEQKIILLQRDYLGNGPDNAEGLINFFEKLVQTELFPSFIILIQDAVKLSALNEHTIICLKKFEKFKVEILVEQESLFKFEIIHKCSVGKVTDLAAINIILMTKKNILSL